jgi:hypothetical protein
MEGPETLMAGANMLGNRPKQDSGDSQEDGRQREEVGDPFGD